MSGKTHRPCDAAASAAGSSGRSNRLRLPHDVVLQLRLRRRREHLDHLLSRRNNGSAKKRKVGGCQTMLHCRCGSGGGSPTLAPLVKREQEYINKHCLKQAALAERLKRPELRAMSSSQ